MDCPYLPQLQYSDFRDRLNRKLVGQRTPLSGSLELTFRCNLRCQHCYVSHGHTGIPGMQELTTEEARDLIDQMVEMGTLWLLLTGGDPLLRRDFLEIYTHARRRGLLVSIFTNGTLITNRIADYLAEWRPFNIEITLYGYTQETYERVTGIPGSYARAMQGIERLDQRGIPYKLKTMVMTLNQHEFADIQDFARQKGAGFRYDPYINPVLNGDRQPLSLRISEEDVIQLEQIVDNRNLTIQMYRDAIQAHNPDDRYLYTCAAGVRSFHIDPYGRLSLCMTAREPQYNLRRGSFKEGWNEFLKDVRYQPADDRYNCNQCELSPICGMCPGWAQIENRGSMHPVEFLCRTTHLRNQAYHLVTTEEVEII